MWSDWIWCTACMSSKRFRTKGLTVVRRAGSFIMHNSASIYAFRSLAVKVCLNLLVRNFFLGPSRGIVGNYHAFRYRLCLGEQVPARAVASKLAMFVSFTSAFLPQVELPTPLECVYSLPSECNGKASDDTASSNSENNVFEATIFDIRNI